MKPAGVAILIACLIGGSSHLEAQNRTGRSALTPQEARAIAREACIYGVPLLENYRVLYSYFVDRGSKEFKAPWNQLHHEARVYTPEDKAIQTPNSDTPYSQLGTDLRAEPLVITVPAVEDDRYYSLQLIDLYTFNYAYIGSRTTGNKPGKFLVAGPRWSGEKPEGIDAVIRCETELGWILYRTQLRNPSDIDGVRKVQAGFKVQPLSAFLAKPAPPSAPQISFRKPLSLDEQRVSAAFFELLNFVLQFCPPHPSEQQLMARFARLGIGPNGTFAVSKLSPEIRKAVEEGIADAWKDFAEFKRDQIDTGRRTAADGFGTREFLRNNYLARMASTVLGIYGNSKEEALYPAYFVDSDGEKLDGASHRYTLRFPRGQLPPVNAFWSLTMYDLPSSLLAANPLKRYLINSPMLADLKRDADDGLTLHLQSESPGKEREANWLPAPRGPFWAVLRLYWPKEEALRGDWQAPPLQRAKDGAAAFASGQGGGGAASAGTPVTIDNFVRAESDTYFAATVKGYDALGKFGHNRQPTPINQQTIVRMNRDTLYSAAVFDLDAGPVTITLPDAGKRFLSMQVINQDHFTPMVAYGGRHVLTREAIGTRYVMAAIRILLNPADPQDLQEVIRLQDSIRVEQKSRGKLELPAWDAVSHKKVRDALLALADTLPNMNRAFGAKGEVDPVRHLLGAAAGWGGNPDKDATYLNVVPRKNDGTTTHRLTVRDVPVDGFWSISVYNAKGFFAANEQDAYSLNNLTARKESDGSVVVQFGGCDGSTPNCLPITPGWNYTVRLYRPRQEILSGDWKFPGAQPVR